jgi:hypothetical protein
MPRYTHSITEKRGQSVGSNLGSDAADDGEDTIRGVMSDTVHPLSFERSSHIIGATDSGIQILLPCSLYARSA